MFVIAIMSDSKRGERGEPVDFSLRSLHCYLSNCSQAATKFAGPEQFLQEGAEVAEKNVDEKTLRSLRPPVKLDWEFLVAVEPRWVICGQKMLRFETSRQKNGVRKIRLSFSCPHFPD